MTSEFNSKSDSGQRGDVGYCRPPVEHRFKSGQKRPPRKAKAHKQTPRSPLVALWKVLHEDRRIVLNGKALWMTNAELLLRKGFESAEKDENSTLSRLIAELILVGEDTEDLKIQDMFIFDKNASPTSETYLVRRSSEDAGPPAIVGDRVAIGNDGRLVSWE